MIILESIVSIWIVCRELSDLGNIWVAIGISMIYSTQAYRQCTQAIAAAIFDFLLLVTSNNVSS